MKVAISVLLAAASFATCAGAAPASSCFRMRDAQSHTVVDAKTLYLSVRGKEVYKMSMKGSCLGRANNTDPLITETFGGGAICRPIDLDLSVDMNGFASHCIIDKIDKLSPEEAAAIPKKLRP